MTFVISRQVSDFASDTIQTRSENGVLPTKILYLNFFFPFNFAMALSAPPLIFTTLSRERRRRTEKESTAVGTPRSTQREKN